jgi:5'-phosphate synthase pdxT subunit
MIRLPGETLARRRSAGPGAREGAAPSAGVRPVDGPEVGVLALQGDVLEHVRALADAGLRTVAVRTAEDLAGCDALVLPGGESTAISRMLDRGGLAGPLSARVAQGMPVLGTCAGLILLSDELEEDGGLPRPRGLAVRTRRNAYGAQRVSFDARFPVVGLAGGPVDASFIRAPRILQVLDPSVEVLAEVDGDPVVVRQGPILAMTFHPEVTGDRRLHELFAGIVRDSVAR